MGIVRFALRFPHTFYVMAALIVFLGVIAVRTMPADIFPEINIPVVSVIWSYSGLSTPEMEQRVSTYSQYSISASVRLWDQFDALVRALLCKYTSQVKLPPVPVGPKKLTVRRC